MINLHKYAGTTVLTFRSHPSQRQSQSSMTRTSGGGDGPRDDADFARSAGVICGYVVSTGGNGSTVMIFAGLGDGRGDGA